MRTDKAGKWRLIFKYLTFTWWHRKRSNHIDANVERTEVVQSLGELSRAEQSISGGKGSTLAHLYQKGYPVPKGFIIIPAAFIADELSAEAKTQVQEHLARLRATDKNTTFAVRSSALSEDSSQASFAGEFETVLGMQTDDDVLDAIAIVRRSRLSERANAYSQSRGLPTAQEMAVVIQRLIQADVSGVLFTVDPVTGSRNHMTGNYVQGLGEKLVSGESKHHHFEISRPKGRYTGPPDLRHFVRRLFKLGMRLEKELGSPQDIEWAIADKKVYVLQSRPITTLMGFDPVTGEFNDSLTGDYVWSNVNIGEAISVVMTPLTWSLLRMCYDDLNVIPGHSSVGNICGRAYQNSTVMVTVLQTLRRNVKDLIKEMGGVRDEYTETIDQYLVPLPGVTLFAILPNVIGKWRRQKAAMKNISAFIAENPGWCRAMCQRIQTIQSKDELVSLAMDEIKPHSFQSFWGTVATLWRYGEHSGKLRRELIEMVEVEDADALLSDVSSDGDLLASLGPVVGLARVARSEMSREEYLEQWGHRGASETELSIPRPLEDPDWLDRQLASFINSSVDVDALLASQRDKFNAAWKRFQDRYPGKAKSIQRRLDMVAEASRLREAIRSECTRLFWVARTWALRVGDLTGIGNNVFFLTFDEVLNLLADNKAPTAYVPARRQTYERHKTLPPYPLIIRGRFDPFQWAADPNRRSDVFDSHGLLTELTVNSSHDNVILGMPGSAGRVEGLVRRLDIPEDGDNLAPGEILVTSQTNIGWTLIFPRARAIVTDVGAPLSHAAIVARELGIPAVVNCGNATARLHTGDRIRVDGVKGIVEILESNTQEGF